MKQKYPLSVWFEAFRSGWNPPRHPFSLWMLTPDDIDPITKENGKSDQNYPLLLLSNAEFRLVPNRLKIYDFAFAFLFSLYGVLALWSQPDFLWEVSWQMAWPLFSLVTIWLIAPALLNILVTRPKVLDSLKAPVQFAYRKWFLGLPSQVIRTEVHGASAVARLAKLGWLLTKWQLRILQLPTSPDPVVWQQTSSGSAGLLNLAMADYFASDGDGWADAGRATLRFLITYCAPIWLSYF